MRAVGIEMGGEHAAVGRRALPSHRLQHHARRRRRRTARRCRGPSSRGCARRSRRRSPGRCAPGPALMKLSATASAIDEAGADRLHVEGGAAGSCRAAPAPWSRSPGRCGPASRSRARSGRDRAAHPGTLERGARPPRRRGRRSSRRRPRYGAGGCRCAGGSTRRRCRAGSASSSLVTTRSRQIGAAARPTWERSDHQRPATCGLGQTVPSAKLAKSSLIFSSEAVA